MSTEPVSGGGAAYKLRVLTRQHPAAITMNVIGRRGQIVMHVTNFHSAASSLGADALLKDPTRPPARRHPC